MEPPQETPRTNSTKVAKMPPTDKTESHIASVLRPLAVAVIVGLFSWVWSVQQQINRVEDYKETKTKFWQIHNQTRAEVNKLIVEINKLRPITDQLNQFNWDLTPPEYGD